MVVVNELSKQVAIITSFILIIVGAYILNTSLDYYDTSIQKSDTFVRDSVELVELAGDSKMSLTTKTLVVGTNEAYNMTVENRSGNLIGMMLDGINNVAMRFTPLRD